jgi:4-amino-4-deoxy-L-arabinose transferase-like glycosyltransferase
MLMRNPIDKAVVLVPTAEGQHAPRIDWRDRIGLTPILLIYFVLALYRIDNQSLWVDEISSLNTAFTDGSVFSPQIWTKGQGPLYFALLNLWGRLANSEAALRSLSVLAGGIAIWLIYVLALHLFNRRTAQISALILGTSPFLIWYSQEIRYITLSIATSLLATYTFRKALTRDSVWPWLWYAVTLILAIGAFVTNIFLPLIHGAYLWSLQRNRPIIPWLKSQAVVFFVAILWANGGELRTLDGWIGKLYNEVTVADKSTLDPATARLSTGGRREFTAVALPYTFFAFSTGFSLGPSLRELHKEQPMAAILPHLPVIGAAAIGFLIPSVLGAIRLWRHSHESLFFALWLGVPILGTLGVAAATELTYNVRYASGSLPAYVLVVALGIAGCRPTVRIVLLGAVLAFSSFSLTNYFLNPRYSREDTRAAARYLESAVQPRDIIISVGSSTAFRHYYKGAVPVVAMSGWNSSDPMKDIRDLARRYDRAWLIEIRPWETDPKAKLRAAFDRVLRRPVAKAFPGVDIYSYQLSRSGL